MDLIEYQVLLPNKFRDLAKSKDELKQQKKISEFVIRIIEFKELSKADKHVLQFVLGG
ncbi:hypothetical protein bcere0011_23730 [Bacillus cereus m1550]|nr:hypothetical protein bcere0011_23730 [Bacillus cereus m1550]